VYLYFYFFYFLQWNLHHPTSHNVLKWRKVGVYLVAWLSSTQFLQIINIINKLEERYFLFFSRWDVFYVIFHIREGPGGCIWRSRSVRQSIKLWERDHRNLRQLDNFLPKLWSELRMLRLQTNFEDFLPAFKNRLFLKSQESLDITLFFK